MNAIESNLLKAITSYWWQKYPELEAGQYKTTWLGYPPDAMFVQQFSFNQADWDRGWFSVERVPEQMWKATLKLLIKERPHILERDELGEIDGMYYQVGYLQFSVSEDRAHVLIGWQVGPRYGRGYIFPLESINGQVVLDTENAQNLWVS